MASTFGDWLVETLASRGMERAHLLLGLEDEGVKVSRQAAWTWETNRSRPKPAHLAALEGVLRLDEDERRAMFELFARPLEGADLDDTPDAEAS